jgi:hypothetical protein
MTKPHLFAARGGGDHITDLHLFIGHHNSINKGGYGAMEQISGLRPIVSAKKPAKALKRRRRCTLTSMLVVTGQRSDLLKL